MKMKKFLAVALVMMVGTMTLGGCATTEEKTPDKVETGSTDTEVKDDKAEPSEPFEFWIPIHPFTAEGMKSLNDHPGTALIEEAVGIDVEFVNPPVGQHQDNINLLLGSMDLPDVFKFNKLEQVYNGGLEGAIEDNVIVDVTALVEENAPNFMAMLDADEQLRKDAYSDTGVLRYFGGTVVYPEARNRAMRGPVINKTLLDQAGLDVPVTIADWEEVLTAFKDMGVQAPFSNQLHRQNAYDVFASAFGVPGSSKFYREGDTVKYGPLQPGYKEYLQLMSDWYGKGLIDPEFPTKEVEKDLNPEMAQGKVGACINYVTAFKNIPNNAKKMGNEIELVPAPYPVLNEGDQIHLREFTPSFDQSGAAYITSEAENPVEVIEFIDFLYSEEGREICTFGVEGETFNVVDGVRVNTPEISSDAYKKRQTLLRDVALTWEQDDHKSFYDLPVQQEAWDVWGIADTEGELPASLQLTIEESQDFVAIKTQIDAYVEEMSLKYIMGIESFDTFDTFIKTLEGMDIEKAVAIQQAAYDRYLAR